MMVYPLQLKQVTKEQEEFRLGPLDLELASGMVYALVGPNGSGKTTLLKTCMNLLKPTSGQVSIYGKTYAEEEDEIKTRISFVPDPLEGCELFTVRQLEQILSPWYPNWNSYQFISCAEQFQLPLDKRYGRLSQGNKKKAALTLALSTRTPLLLLDEPTNGLDIPSRGRLKQMLADDAEELERTVLLSTHSAEDIKQYADSIVLLKSGRLEGPFDKDSLVETWSRMWLAGGDSSELSAAPGFIVVSGEETSFAQIVTSDREATLAYLADKRIEVTRDQSMPLDEILEYLLK